MAEKNAYKEGLKKAQQFSSVHKAGGLSYFCTNSDVAEGEHISLLEHVMKGINSDKKAQHFGKLILACDDDTIVGMIHVPHELVSQNRFSALDWVDAILDKIQNRDALDIEKNMSEANGRVILRVNQEKEVFAFKVCSDMMDKSSQVLREKNLLPKRGDDDEEEDDVDYAESLGIEW